MTSHNQIPVAGKQRFHSMATGLSGSIVSTDIPIEARGRPKKGASDHDTHSPKISCIGQINMHKLKTKTKMSQHDKNNDDVQRGEHKEKVSKSKKQRRPLSWILEFIGCRFSGSETAYNSRKSGYHGKFAGGARDKDESSNTRLVPSLSFSDLEWMARDDPESKEVRLPYSAPVLLVSEGVILLQPKREINIWQRRKTASPPPLQV